MRNLGKKQIGVYQRSRKWKAGRSETSYTSPCTDPVEEPSPSEGAEECSLFFHEEEEEAIKDSVTKGKGVHLQGAVSPYA